MAELSFGEWLEDQLRERGWTQAAFADLAQVSRTTVNSWINSVQPPRRRAARDIARALNVDVDEVLVRAGYPPTRPDYVLPEDRPKSTHENREGYDERVTFFAANADKLSDEDWEMLRRFIERLTERGDL